MEQVTTQDVTESPQQNPKPLASLSCALSGHIFRVVLLGKAPTTLECSRCARSWPVEGAPGE